MRIVVETNDGFVLWIYDEEDCEGWRPDVCHVSWIQSDDVGIGIVDGNVDVMLEYHPVDGDGWKCVERPELVDEKVVEGGSCFGLESCPQRPGYWIRPCSSSAASSLPD